LAININRLVKSSKKEDNMKEIKRSTKELYKSQERISIAILAITAFLSLLTTCAIIAISSLWKAII